MRLYRFEASCYARKAQMVLDLLGRRYECIDVAYGNRSGLASITGGYIQVPVLVDDDGSVIVDSRTICAHLLGGTAGEGLLPSPWQGPIWAYADWCDGPLEDVMFRLASPGMRRRLADPWERALYVFIKERKFGKGCVDEWEADRDALLATARALLEPSRHTLGSVPFLFGDRPTLADAALYGQLVMLEVADRSLPGAVAPEFVDWMRRIRARVDQRESR